MTRLAAHPLAGVIASAVLLTAILGYLVIDRVHLVLTGREIVLPIRPVDPRDLFKGDYARLGYTISRPDHGLVADLLAEPRVERKVFVTIEQAGDGAWQVVAVKPTRPGNLAPNQVLLAGRLSPWGDASIRYGIERYFVPEGTGGKLEELARTSMLSAIVAVGSDGRAAIKGLVHNGQPIYVEPLF
jgi:uncharacterized membrane-anchored protein